MHGSGIIVDMALTGKNGLLRWVVRNFKNDFTTEESFLLLASP